MNFRKNQSFWTSVILHAVVLIGLLLATVIEVFKPKEKEHVFVMVDPPSANAVNQVDPQPQNVPEPQLNLPELPDLTEVPDLPEPAPTPPAPVPAPPKPKAADAPPKPKTLSYEEFIKQQGQPKPIQRAQPTPTKPAQAPTLNTDRIQQQLNEILKNEPTNNAPTPLTQQDMSELLRYNQRLSAMLTRAWGKPTGLSGVRLEATVIFDVSSSGQLTNIRLKPGSGNRAFDQSVLAAFSKVANAGPTPTRRSHTFEKSFKMVD